MLIIPRRHIFQLVQIFLFVFLSTQTGFFLCKNPALNKRNFNLMYLEAMWQQMLIKIESTLPFLLHSEWDPQPLPQLSPTRLQSSAECWYPHQKANNQSQGDCDTNQQPSQAWNKEGIQRFRTEQVIHIYDMKRNNTLTGYKLRRDEKRTGVKKAPLETLKSYTVLSRKHGNE